MAGYRPWTRQSGRDSRQWLTVVLVDSRSGSQWRRSQALTLLPVDRK